MFQRLGLLGVLSVAWPVIHIALKEKTSNFAGNIFQDNSVCVCSCDGSLLSDRDQSMCIGPVKDNSAINLQLLLVNLIYSSISKCKCILSKDNLTRDLWTEHCVLKFLSI